MNQSASHAGGHEPNHTAAVDLRGQQPASKPGARAEGASYAKPVRRSAWQDLAIDRLALTTPKKSRPRTMPDPKAVEFVKSLATMDDFADVSDMALSAGVDQRTFLLAVMALLALTRLGLSRRLSTSEVSVNKWMDSPEGSNRRQLPPTVWKHLGEVVRQHLCKTSPKKVKQRIFATEAASPI